MAKNYEIHITPAIASCLSFLKKGQRFEPHQFIEENKSRVSSKGSAKSISHMMYHGLSIGKKLGLLKNIELYPISFQDFCKLESVEYCGSQLRGSKYTNIKAGSNDWSTQKMYLYKLWNFNNWLAGKKFEFSRMLMTSQNTYKRANEKITLKGLEHFLRLLKESYNSDADFIKIIKRYLLDPMHSGKRASSVVIIHSAIKSYFETNDCPLTFKFNAKAKYKVSNDEDEKPSLTIEDFFRILTIGRASITQKAMYLCKFHRGLDSSTLADRFNFQAWPQLVKWFGTTNPKSWNLDKVPVPIRLTRIKTNFTHIGFLDRDAVSAVQDYLEYRYQKTGKQMQEGDALFLNKQGQPITTRWIREGFSKLAKSAGLQHKLAGYSQKYSKDTHELRDLLKSTLISTGTRYDVADHVIGHKPKDSYEKQASLFPENFRIEYMKGSRKLNIFSKVSHYMKGDEQTEILRNQIDVLKQELETRKTENDEFSDYKTKIDRLEKKIDDLDLSKKFFLTLLDKVQEHVPGLSVQVKDKDQLLNLEKLEQH